MLQKKTFRDAPAPVLPNHLLPFLEHRGAISCRLLSRLSSLCGLLCGVAEAPHSYPNSLETIRLVRQRRARGSLPLLGHKGKDGHGKSTNARGACRNAGQMPSWSSATFFPTMIVSHDLCVVTYRLQETDRKFLTLHEFGWCLRLE